MNVRDDDNLNAHAKEYEQWVFVSVLVSTMGVTQS